MTWTASNTVSKSAIIDLKYFSKKEDLRWMDVNEQTKYIPKFTLLTKYYFAD